MEAGLLLASTKITPTVETTQMSAVSATTASSCCLIDVGSCVEPLFLLRCRVYHPGWMQKLRCSMLFSPTKMASAICGSLTEIAC
eukprot:1873290-Pleurochrysis_carterae.AAC.1